MPNWPDERFYALDREAAEDLIERVLEGGGDRRTCQIAASAASAARAGLTQDEWRGGWQMHATVAAWICEGLSVCERDLRAAGLWPPEWPEEEAVQEP